MKSLRLLALAAALVLSYAVAAAAAPVNCPKTVSYTHLTLPTIA